MLSFMFFALSACLNAFYVPVACSVAKRKSLRQDSKQVQVQQRAIIHSLKKIEQDISKKDVVAR